MAEHMETNNVKGKRILLLCEDFFGYDQMICEELMSMGAEEVHLKNAAFFRSSLRERESFRIKKFLHNPHERRDWTREFEKEIEGKRFDMFLCVENACFSKSFMTYLRAKNPGVKCALFLWDKYETQQGGFKDYRFLFDKVYSFDRDDCQKYSMEYFPDFYIPQTCPDHYDYDLSFVGTARRKTTIHRFALMDYVYQFCLQHGLKSHLYLKAKEPGLKKYSKAKQYFKEHLFQSKYRRLYARYKEQPWLKTESLPLDDCIRIQNSAKVLLDLNHTNRQGMTLNAIAAIANGQKLITTNKRIKEEAFYDPDMIYVMDDKNPHLDIDFFNRPCRKVDISYLRIDNWLNHILSF